MEVSSGNKAYESRILISFPYRSLQAGADIGKLYVTNSAFSNGIGGLCVVILHLFFHSVKFFAADEC